MFIISREGKEPIINVDTAEAIGPAIRACAPGRYRVDEIGAAPSPSGRTSRRWGVWIKQSDGSVTLEPDPWDPVGQP